MSMRVAIAEDSYLMREGLTSLLELAEDVDLVATCTDADELIAAVEADPPDVVITDIRMPPTQTDEGIRAALRIRKEHPGVGVVVLSQYAEPEYAFRLFADGSEGLAYLLKERVADLEALLAALHAVTTHGSVVDPSVVDVLVAARIAEEKSLLHRLSPREVDVLSAMAQGLNNGAIAESLGVSQGAVEKHINSIFTKLDVSFDDSAHRRVRAVLLYLAEA
jgi:DNA-binding NarL/FixJ family response regulator